MPYSGPGNTHCQSGGIQFHPQVAGQAAHVCTAAAGYPQFTHRELGGGVRSDFSPACLDFWLAKFTLDGFGPAQRIVRQVGQRYLA